MTTKIIKQTATIGVTSIGVDLPGFSRSAIFSTKCHEANARHQVIADTNPKSTGHDSLSLYNQKSVCCTGNAYRYKP